MPGVCWLLGVTEATYYGWRREYGGLWTDRAKNLRESEQGERLSDAAAGRAGFRMHHRDRAMLNTYRLSLRLRRNRSKSLC